jgi:hypothetical protein
MRRRDFVRKALAAGVGTGMASSEGRVSGWVAPVSQKGTGGNKPRMMFYHDGHLHVRAADAEGGV